MNVIVEPSVSAVIAPFIDFIATVPVKVVSQFFRTVIASLLAPAAVPLPITNNLSVATYVVAFPAPVVAYVHITVSDSDCAVDSFPVQNE